MKEQNAKMRKEICENRAWQLRTLLNWIRKWAIVKVLATTQNDWSTEMHPCNMMEY